MRHRPFLAILVLGTLASGCAGSPPPTEQVRQLRVRIGDDPRWAQPGFDDGDWQMVALDDAPHHPGPLWLRGEVEVRPEHRVAGHPLGVLFAALASHELYWDGERIGRGGVVGPSAEEEEPGPISAHYAVPERLAAPGRHQLAIRASGYHRGYEFSSPWWVLAVGDYDTLALAGGAYAALAATSLSGILLGGAFALVLFLLDRRDRASLVLALLCLTAAALLVAESWRAVVGYTYDWHLARLLAVTSLSWLLSVLLVLFVTTRFPLPGARRVAAVTPVALVVPLFLTPGWDGRAALMFLLGLAVALGWALLARRRRLPGSLATALALGIAFLALFVEPFSFADLTLFFALDLLLLFLLASHALATRRESRRRQTAELSAARLELELLRRHLQPHFLMNTLTALSEWIEEDPREATAMVQALAGELRLLARVSRQRLIPLADELRLCELHLQVMGRRRGRSYRLLTAGVDPAAPVPPAVLHTLVENAVTHGGQGVEEVTLRLTAEAVGGGTRYVFEAPRGRDFGAEGDDPPGGTGLAYVRARLAESFGDRWRLEHGPAGLGWRTAITLPQA